MIGKIEFPDAVLGVVVGAADVSEIEFPSIAVDRPAALEPRLDGPLLRAGAKIQFVVVLRPDEAVFTAADEVGIAPPPGAGQTRIALRVDPGERQGLIAHHVGNELAAGSLPIPHRHGVLIRFDVAKLRVDDLQGQACFVALTVGAPGLHAQRRAGNALRRAGDAARAFLEPDPPWQIAGEDASSYWQAMLTCINLIKYAQRH